MIDGRFLCFLDSKYFKIRLFLVNQISKCTNINRNMRGVLDRISLNESTLLAKKTNSYTGMFGTLRKAFISDFSYYNGLVPNVIYFTPYIR